MNTVEFAKCLGSLSNRARVQRLVIVRQGLVKYLLRFSSVNEAVDIYMKPDLYRKRKS